MVPKHNSEYWYAAQQTSDQESKFLLHDVWLLEGTGQSDLDTPQSSVHC